MIVRCEIIVDGIVLCEVSQLVPIIRRSNCSLIYMLSIIESQVRRLRRAGFTPIAVVDQRGPLLGILVLSQTRIPAKVNLRVSLYAL
jgi:hypothetical protein